MESNNQDTFLHPDPEYICDTQNFQEVILDSNDMIKMYDMRWYRENPRGVDKLLFAKSVDKEKIIGKKLYFRSPMTCASAARGHGICYRCYGLLAWTNQDINIGQIAAEGLSSIYTQILLSAKHLLESLVVKMEWTPGFSDLFEVTFNTIALKELGVYRGYKLIINEEISTKEEIDEVDYNYFITNFIVRQPDGTEINIHTSEADNLYIDPDFYNYIMSMSTANDDYDFYCEMDMVKLMDFDILFMVEIKNNELSATMDKIKKLIDNKSVIQQYDRHELLRQFTITNIQGNIKLNAVHFEVLLMNQIRAIDDILEMPDWTRPNEPYQVLTLSKSLSENRSISVRLQNSKVQKALLNPMNEKLYKPSMVDVFYMEQPQEFLDPNIISDEYKPLSDKEDNVRCPIRFDNPKIRVSRRQSNKSTPNQNMYKEENIYKEDN